MGSAVNAGAACAQALSGKFDLADLLHDHEWRIPHTTGRCFPPPPRCATPAASRRSRSIRRPPQLGWTRMSAQTSHRAHARADPCPPSFTFPHAALVPHPAAARPCVEQRAWLQVPASGRAPSQPHQAAQARAVQGGRSRAHRRGQGELLATTASQLPLVHISAKAWPPCQCPSLPLAERRRPFFLPHPSPPCPRRQAAREVQVQKVELADPSLPPRHPGAARRPAAQKDAAGRQHTRWTEEEVAALQLGVTTFGEGQWDVVLETYEARFQAGRTPADLRDKWAADKSRQAESYEAVYLVRYCSSDTTWERTAPRWVTAHELAPQPLNSQGWLLAGQRIPIPLLARMAPRHPKVPPQQTEGQVWRREVTAARASSVSTAGSRAA